MQAGTFIVFSLITDTEHRRAPTKAVSSHTRDAELESAFIRSHVAHVKHARRRLGTPGSFNLWPRSRQFVRPKRDDRESRPERQTSPPLLATPSTPYERSESELLQWYFDHICLVRGTGDSPAQTFWEVIVPQMAWHEQCIKHAFLAQASAMKVYTDKRWGRSYFYRSLKYQNSAVQQLARNSIDIPTLLAAATILSVGCMYMNEWEQVYQHSLAVLKLSNALDSKVTDELKPALNYARQLCEDVLDAYCAITGTVLPRSVRRLGHEVVGKGAATAVSNPYPESVTTAQGGSYCPSEFGAQGSTTAKERQQMFFDSLMGLAVTQHDLHHIIKALQCPIMSPGYQHLLHTNLMMATLNFALSTLTKVAWLYNRWTSETYQRQYLTNNQRRELLHLRGCLQSYANSQTQDNKFETYLAWLVSPVPLFREINAFASLLDADRQSFLDDASDHPGRLENNHWTQPTPSDEFPVLRIRHFSYTFVPIVAGEDPRLRQDIWEWLSVT
ncbi:uncharacterized protein Z520_08503 [Fonsecaea multimorphosa CBS 102226]|uniref:Transcription factor domain-containing protein n=1 Tax=Fonsecaea multimorphosa CBS 102226 TaxID=1442371 RepID=A0A0D2H1U5_9EURO|nr:uncharacterized protein Z520_08503 [Fonsecaea multimorphosa CBS 102226]KIX95795.1 hypothetical protein Z520_08503 [Fonsecaea multimorphosa CBS 102226]OAL21531.1 hypothetical protein AYO22_07927 [Fonsecaea multimorphosa]